MDCCICTSIPYMLRPPRNTICGTCYEGAKNLLCVLNKTQTDQKGIEKANNSMVSQPNSCKTLMDVWRLVSDTKDATEELDEKIRFLGGFVAAFRDQIHTDIFLKPSNNGPTIPAHKALMAIRSEVFKNMLDSDSCKAPANDGVTFPDLKHEELDTLLEFLYNGSLSEEKMNTHVYSLALAADKYFIPYLRKICERHMTGSLCSSNALDVLEIADVCSYQRLKETVLKFIVRNMQEIVFSSAYDAFALKNPHLSVQITRALLKDSRKN